ncbi:hypothetical protein FRB90_008847 [Tulasnella sp. 427]|nr:hypothetical protein FRB90_008847 [Tulasnella sp. 427]
MLAFNLLTLVPAFLSLGVNAAVIPNSVQKADIVPRCDTCPSGPGVGNGIASSIHASADVDAALRFFSNDQFTFTSNVADVFAHATGDVKSQVNSVLTIGSGLLTWSAAELTGLVTTLDGYATGTVSTGAAILTKAAIDVTTFTAAEAAYLKAFVVNVVQSDVQLASEVKADLVLFVRNAVVLANVTCSDLQARIRDNVTTLASAVAALHLDAKVATCASAAVAIKLAIKAYVESSIAATTVLTAATTKVALDTVLKIVNAWIKADFVVVYGAALSLLGMDLKAASDAAICKALVAYLMSINVKFNFVTAYGLDAALYAKVFSATAGN